MLVDSIEIFPTKREMGYLKAIHFKIPVLRDYGDFTDVMTIWDYYPDILDEEGNFNGYSPEDDLPERDMLKERADADGNIPVIDEQGEQEKIRLFKLRLARINTLRAEQGLPELTAEEFLARCRPKEITDESIVCLSKLADTHIELEIDPEELDTITAKVSPTYPEIKAYVLEHHGMKVSSLAIAQAKRKCGLEVGECYNLPSGHGRPPTNLTPEKEAAIRDAFQYYGLI